MLYCFKQEIESGRPVQVLPTHMNALLMQLMLVLEQYSEFLVKVTLQT